jgi:hypothetical protein
MATFKFCGVPKDVRPEIRVDISILTGWAYPELVKRFGDQQGLYTMSPCRLLLFKCKSKPPLDIGITVEQLRERPCLLGGKATLGVNAITNLLLAGAGNLRVTGFDLWTGIPTSHAEYPHFVESIRAKNGAGLDRASVARSAGTHGALSQLTYLRSLHKVGRITVDETLRAVLSLTEEEYMERMESVHGFPFAER